MRNFKFGTLALLALAALSLSSCLHVVEEVFFKDNGSGKYTMKLDLSEAKGMMDMMKNMAPDSLKKDSASAEPAPTQDNGMSQMGEDMSKVASSLNGLSGITNVVETKDTANFVFGYTFDFQDVASLNKALRVLGKEKFDSKTEEVFKLDGKKFERLPVGDFGSELKKQMATSDGGDESQMEMVKMFFADMTYKQIYHFERKVKKSTNALSEMGDDGQTVTITLKPFDEEQAKKGSSTATKIKLK